MASADPEPSITATVTEIVARVLSVAEDTVTPGSRLVDDLDADSLDLSEIAASLTARGFRVDKAAVKAKAGTVADLIELVDPGTEEPS